LSFLARCSVVFQGIASPPHSNDAGEQIPDVSRKD
jgi:hypothetical protein